MGYKPMAVALITGYLGAGKTTLLNKILSNPKGHKVAVIVNDIGQVNIDASLIEKGGNVTQQDDNLVPLTNGCICCTLKTDLIQQIVDLANMKKFDYVLIEASGICEPIPIAQTITMMQYESERRNMPEICFLDNIISVVDALRLAKEFNCGEGFEEIAAEEAEEDDEEEEEDITSLLVQQMEFCNTVILNKCELVSEEEKGKIKAVIKALSPEAKIIETSYSEADINDLMDTKLFDYRKASTSAGWIRALDNPEEVEPETLEYGIGTYIYKERKPFIKVKFEKLADKWPKSVIRAKGYIWIKERPQDVYLFEQAGPQISVQPDGMWIAAAPEDEKQKMLKQYPHIAENWDEKYGDRLTELVFIGQDMDTDAIKEELDKCLGDF